MGKAIERATYILCALALILSLLVIIQHQTRPPRPEGYALEGKEKEEYNRIAKKKGKQTLENDRDGKGWYFTNQKGQRCKWM
jgi:hypothetical protein